MVCGLSLYDNLKLVKIEDKVENFQCLLLTAARSARVGRAFLSDGCRNVIILSKSMDLALIGSIKKLSSSSSQIIFLLVVCIVSG